MRCKIPALILFMAIFFAGCAKDPGEVRIKETIADIEKEKAEKCGDGVTDSWEECTIQAIFHAANILTNCWGRSDALNAELTFPAVLKKRSVIQTYVVVTAYALKETATTFIVNVLHFLPVLPATDA